MDGRLKLLIAYDGSDCADAALDDLMKAGLPRATEARIISVSEVWLPPPAPEVDEILAEARAAETPAYLQKLYAQKSLAVEEAQARANRARERLARVFPSWEVRAEATSGSPAWEIIRMADHWRPDLVVVGSHGRTALGRFVLGSVSQKVLTEARCSVRIARGRVEVETDPVRVLIGVDGSPGSAAAVLAVARRPWPPGSEARVVVVDDPLVPTTIGRLLPPVNRWIEEENQEERSWAEGILREAAAKLPAGTLKVSTLVAEGDPKRMLVEEAEEWNADAIFVGSSGFSNRLERFLLGSVSAAVAARAHCSVEVVRA